MSGNEADYGYTRDVIASGRKLLAEIDRRAPDGVRWAVRTASATRMLPAQLQEIIASELLGAVRTLTKQAGSALRSAEAAVNGAGSPTSLRVLADRIDTNVGAKATDLAPRVRSDVLLATDEQVWSGHAASLYRKAMEGQGEAVERIFTSSGSLSSVCRHMADHLEGFMGFLTASIIGLVSAAAGLILAVAAMPEALYAAILAVGGASLGLLAAATGLVTTLWANHTTMQSFVRDATLTVQAWPAARFQGGR